MYTFGGDSPIDVVALRDRLTYMRTGASCRENNFSYNSGRRARSGADGVHRTERREN